MVMGILCDQCKPGYFNLSKTNPLGCSPCDCNRMGSVNIAMSNLSYCNEITGECNCKTINVQGRKCDDCIELKFNISNSCNSSCNCDPYGSISPVCNKSTGQCDCKPNVAGLKCSECHIGFFNLTSFGENYFSIFKSYYFKMNFKNQRLFFKMRL